MNAKERQTNREWTRMEETDEPRMNADVKGIAAKKAQKGGIFMEGHSARSMDRPRPADEQELIPTVMRFLIFASMRGPYSCPFAVRLPLRVHSRQIFGMRIALEPLYLPQSSQNQPLLHIKLEQSGCSFAQ